jgi:hypothetical protein
MLGMAQPTSENNTGAATPKRRSWSPRMWEGCNFVAWFRLLLRGRFAVQLRYLHIAIVVSFVSMMHSVLKLIHDVIYGGRIRRTEIRQAPIFIVGHWRTGTTLLHELLIQDERFNFPNTYECMEPNHFLLTEKLFTRIFRWVTPSHRPMDNMAAGFDKPQEDEFALCMLGQPSPYLMIAFPNQPPCCQEYLDLEGVPAAALESWKNAFVRLLKQLTYKNPKRLVLKSPPHSCRIKVLTELFPDARFIHIVRDPHVVFPSTVNLWKSLSRAHGLQTPKFVGLEEYVYQTFLRVYEKLEEGKRLVPGSHFCELRYEDLVRNPVEEVRKIYEQLGLGEFEQMRPRLERYLEGVKNYETNRYQITPEQRAEIGRRWGDVIRRYGYDAPAEERTPVSQEAMQPQGSASR